MNVLFVVADDLRPQLGCYGKGWIQSPRIDAFASQSLVCERAYCQQAVCAPSRASVLTGCRPETTTIYDLQTPVRSVMPNVVTLPQLFQQYGYETMSVGKVYHHPDDDLESWDGGAVLSPGDWQGRGYLTDEAIEDMEAYNRRAERENNPRRGLGPAFEAADVPDDAYPDGKDTACCIEELRRLSSGAKPFFLAFGLHKPHLPFNAPKRYWDKYDPATVPLAENPFPPEEMTSFTLPMYKDLWEIGGYTNIHDETQIDDNLARHLIHGYAACVSYIDTLFGRVLDELEELGIADNTIVILWGDHGWKLGEHGCWCKHTNMEIDTHAPLILKVPGRTNGERTRALVEFVDIYPTLAELCGIPIPAHCEGTSMVPLLDDPRRTWKSAAFSQYPRGDVMGTAMRTDRYRYVEWCKVETGECVTRELYDHEQDSQENTNIANRVSGVLLDNLSNQLRAGWKQAGRGESGGKGANSRLESPI